MRRGGKDSASRRALRSIVEDAGRARLGDRLPPSQRPSGFMISIGLGGEHDPDDEDWETVKDGEPEMPGNGHKLPPEDLETYGVADKDDEGTPGRRRRRR